MTAASRPPSTRAAAPSVYAMVLSYNGLDHLEYSLPSVLATEYAGLHVVLIDNGSTDGSVALAQGRYPQIDVIGHRRNLGWAAANNVGIRHALERGANYIALLNNDVRVDPRWLAQAVTVADRDPRIGVLGFDTIGEYHLEADPDLVLFRRRQAAWQHLEVTESEHVAGCAMFIRAQLLREVGLFDERFFAYSEEDDLQKRAHRAGYRIVRINIPLWHFNGGYWNEHRPLRASVLAQRNSIREMIKNESWGMALRRFSAMVRFICHSDPAYDRTLADLRRLRPSIYPVNVAILTYAIVWNAVMLPGTLRSRLRDERRVQEARRHWPRTGYGRS